MLTLVLTGPLLTLLLKRFRLPGYRIHTGLMRKQCASPLWSRKTPCGFCADLASQALLTARIQTSGRLHAQTKHLSSSDSQHYPAPSVSQRCNLLYSPRPAQPARLLLPVPAPLLNTCPYNAISGHSDAACSSTAKPRLQWRGAHYRLQLEWAWLVVALNAAQAPASQL